MYPTLFEWSGKSNSRSWGTLLVIGAFVVYRVSMAQLKELDSLPEAQQKALAVIFRIKKPSFRTSEVIPKMNNSMNGRSVGGVLGSLFRNGYLKRLQGGRDKMWKLSNAAEQLREEIKQQLLEVRAYWS